MCCVCSDEPSCTGAWSVAPCVLTQRRTPSYWQGAIPVELFCLVSQGDGTPCIAAQSTFAGLLSPKLFFCLLCSACTCLYSPWQPGEGACLVCVQLCASWETLPTALLQSTAASIPATYLPCAPSGGSSSWRQGSAGWVGAVLFAGSASWQCVSVLHSVGLEGAPLAPRCACVPRVKWLGSTLTFELTVCHTAHHRPGFRIVDLSRAMRLHPAEWWRLLRFPLSLWESVTRCCCFRGHLAVTLMWGGLAVCLCRSTLVLRLPAGGLFPLGVNWLPTRCARCNALVTALLSGSPCSWLGRLVAVER